MLHLWIERDVRDLKEVELRQLSIEVGNLSTEKEEYDVILRTLTLSQLATAHVINLTDSSLVKSRLEILDQNNLYAHFETHMNMDISELQTRAKTTPHNSW
eukprot:TRINITY_DN222_c0_g1_i1.p2 TRINITY_DN222_c0_g1~~TRINITY_DN222_c0_g1_i1.p2  ORF type:complete len:101 (+),score=6.43 TRINITY_DN222_c0_g1_i1:935-1237(+)